MFTQNCAICGEEFDSEQPAVTCSNRCKMKRYRMNKRESGVTRGNVTPVEKLYTSPVSTDAKVDELKLEIQELKRMIASLLANGYQSPVPSITVTVPPDVKVNVVFDEEAARKRSVENTIAALEDF